MDDIALGAQIARTRLTPEGKKAHAMDFLVRNGPNMYVIGEAKHWFADARPGEWEMESARFAATIRRYLYLAHS